jgi:hypothetical protein
MKAMSTELQRNSEAEAAHVRRTVWGETQSDKRGSDVNDTILGDLQVHYPAPVVVQPPNNNSWLPIALTALTALAGGGIAGYLANGMRPKTEPTPVNFDDSTVEIGLGRIEDYLKEDEGR